MQAKLIVGDTLNFLTSVPDYPASEGWTLTFRLVPRTSGTAIEFSATAEGVDYRSTVSASTTDGWAAGEYSWASYVTLSGERYTVETGTITLLPDPGVATTLDSRSHARIVLENIEAVIEGRATTDQQEYTIGQRSLRRMTVDDLIKLRTRYRNEVYAEDQAARAASNLGGGRLLARL